MNSKTGRSRRRRTPPLMVVRSDGTLRPSRSRQPATGQPLFPVVVAFARGSATPRGECLGPMHAAAQWLSRHADERATIVGHANLRSLRRPASTLAQARVEAVTDLMVLLGASRQQLIPLDSVRLHEIPGGSTLGQRRRQRVVVIHRHEPPAGAVRSIVRRVSRRIAQAAS